MNWPAWLTPRLRHDCNVAVPLFVLGYFSVAPRITTAWARWRGEDVDAPNRFVATVDAAGIIGLLLLLAALALSLGLAPRRLSASRAWLNRLGHRALFVINLSVFATALLPLLLAKLTGIGAIGQLMWLGVPVLALATLAWPVAVLLVWAGWGRSLSPESSR